MTDALIRPATVTMTALAMLAVIVDAPASLRVPVVLVFALLAPGLALTRFIPTLEPVDRLALGPALSLALLILSSLLLVAVGQWSGEPVLAALAALTLFFSFLPQRSPWRAFREQNEQARATRARARRRSQRLAYDQVLSNDPDERRLGLTSLSWLLEDDGRIDEARRLREISRLPVPPRLPEPGAVPSEDIQLRDAHIRARSDDPETRRRGLFEVAALLEQTGHPDEAASLRGIASTTNNDEI